MRVLLARLSYPTPVPMVNFWNTNQSLNNVSKIVHKIDSDIE